MKSFLPANRDTVTKLSAMIIATVFICLIALQAYTFWKSLQQTESLSATKPRPVSSAHQNTLDTGRLAAMHLFGDVEKTVVQDSEVKEDKSLNLTLRGIVANSSGNASLAIIESKPDGEETFAPGDAVFNKGQLNSVAIDHVILMRNDGRLVKLQLPEQESADGENEDYLPQAQPPYVAPEMPAPEQSSDNNAAPEPAMAIPAEPEQQNQEAIEPETSSETTLDAPANDHQNATPAQH